MIESEEILEEDIFLKTSRSWVSENRRESCNSFSSFLVKTVSESNYTSSKATSSLDQEFEIEHKPGVQVLFYKFLNRKRAGVYDIIL